MSLVVASDFHTFEQFMLRSTYSRKPCGRGFLFSEPPGVWGGDPHGARYSAKHARRIAVYIIKNRMIREVTFELFTRDGRF